MAAHSRTKPLKNNEKSPNERNIPLHGGALQRTKVTVFPYRITSPADKAITYHEQNQWGFDKVQEFRFGASTRF